MKNRIPGSGARHNPFSSHCVQPGSIPYLYAPDLPLHRLLERWERAGSIGQIVGPHGSGKSTLLHSLAQGLANRGDAVLLVDAGESRMPRPAPGRTLLLDSADRLPLLVVRNLARQTQNRNGGMIVTAHADVGLPILMETTVSDDTASAVVHFLLRDTTLPRPSGDTLRHLLHQHSGNLRLVLFELYDWFEERCRVPGNE